LVHVVVLAEAEGPLDVTVKAFLTTVGVVCGFIGGWLLVFAIALQDQCPERDGLPCGDWDSFIWAGAFGGALLGAGIGWGIGRWWERR
jgi:hypothetical protein